jgi:multisubunit Na+/H+ antiporter MnhB subunit
MVILSTDLGFSQNLSGTIVAVINLISIAVAPNPRTAAIYYFITALFILLACFDTYFALPLNVSGEERFRELFQKHC